MLLANIVAIFSFVLGNATLEEKVFQMIALSDILYEPGNYNTIIQDIIYSTSRANT